MHRRPDRELQALQEELLAVEEEEYEEEEWEEEPEDGYDSGEPEDEDWFGPGDGQEPIYRNHANRYGRGSPKKFDDDDFFDEGFDDTDVLYRRDYKKAKRKKRRRTFGLMLLAILELFAIGAILLWFMSWIQ